MITITEPTEYLNGIYDCIEFSAVLDEALSSNVTFWVRIIEATTDDEITAFGLIGKTTDVNEQTTVFDVKRILTDYTEMVQRPTFGTFTPIAHTTPITKFYIEVSRLDKTANELTQTETSNVFAFWKGYEASEGNKFLLQDAYKKVVNDKEVWVSYLVENESGATKDIELYADIFFVDGTVLFGNLVHTETVTDNAIIHFPLKKDILDSEPIARYEVYVQEKEASIIVFESERINFEVLQNKCAESFLFANDLGGYETCIFSSISEGELQIEREEYNNVVECGLNSRIRTTFFVDNKVEYTTRSFVIKDEENKTYKQFLASIDIYLEKQNKGFIPMNFTSDKYRLYSKRNIVFLAFTFFLSVACEDKLQDATAALENVTISKLQISDNDFYAEWSPALTGLPNDKFFLKVQNLTNPVAFPLQILERTQEETSLYIRDLEYQPLGGTIANNFGNFGDVLRIEYWRFDSNTNVRSKSKFANAVCGEFYFPPFPSDYFQLNSVTNLGVGQYEFEFEWSDNAGNNPNDRLFARVHNTSNGEYFANGVNCNLGLRGSGIVIVSQIFEEANAGSCAFNGGTGIINSGDVLSVEYWIDNPTTQYESEHKTLIFVVP